MGLDVYLYRAKNLSETQKRQSQHQEDVDRLWEVKEKYEDFTEDEKENIRQKSKESEFDLLIADGGEYAEEKIELDHPDFPEHYFKIGYFRSSYNGGGINNILSNLGIADLYDIFQPNDEYCFEPDWNQALINVNKAITNLQSAPKYGVQDLYSFGMKSDVKDANEALNVFLEELNKHTDNSFGSYSNGKGEFHLKEPLKVYGFVEGQKYNNRCIFVITDANYDWYINALIIVKDTIEYVLKNQGSEFQYYLHWSG